MRKIFTMLFCLMAIALSFTSCSKDNENEEQTFNESYLIGVWESYDGETITISFNVEGEYVVKTPNRTINGKYTVKDRLISWNNPNMLDAKILSLDNSQMVLEFYKTRSVQNTHNDIIHFKRKSE